MSRADSPLSGWHVFFLGAAIVAVWIACWHAHLDELRIHALARIEPCPIEKPAPSDSWWEQTKKKAREALELDKYFTECGRRVEHEKDQAQAILTSGMSRAWLVSPLAFFIAAFILRSGRRIATRQEDAANAREQRRQQRVYEEQDKALVLENQTTKIRQARTDFVKRLGQVSDCLDLLAEATAPDQAMLLKQNISSELREIVARHTMDELAVLIRRDEVIQYKLRALGQRLQEHRVRSDDAALLLTLVPEAPHPRLTKR